MSFAARVSREGARLQNDEGCVPMSDSERICLYGASYGGYAACWVRRRNNPLSLHRRL